MNKYPTFSNPTDAEQLSGERLDATIYSSLARYLSERQDAAIRQAINNHLGRKDWSIEEVKSRLALYGYQGSDRQTITMDGEPIMSIGSVEMNTEERGRPTFLRATRGFKILNETNA